MDTNSTYEPLLDDGGSSCDQREVAACQVFQNGGGAEGGREAERSARRRLVYALLICLVACLAEVVGGILAHSLALLTDAAHLLSDLSGYVIGLFALWAVSLKANNSHSFGYHRVEILGALLSILVICAVTGGLVIEAFHRVLNPVQVDGKVMCLVATFGLCVNLLLLAVLGSHGHSHGPVGGTCSGHGHSHGHDHGHSHGAAPRRLPPPCSEVPMEEVASPQSALQPPLSPPSLRRDLFSVSAASRSRGGGGGPDTSLATGPSCLGAPPPPPLAPYSAPPPPPCCPLPLSPVGSPGRPSHGQLWAMRTRSHSHGGQPCAGHPPQPPPPPPHAGIASSGGTGESRGGADMYLPCEAHAHGSVGRCEEGHDGGGSSGDGGRTAWVGNLFGVGGDAEANINVRAATLHVVGDLVQSIGVIIASAIIWVNPKWSIADPICTFVFALLVLMTTFGMLREILDILMERTPRSINIKEVSEALWDVQGVVNVQCLHVWALTSGKYLVSVNVQVEQGRNEEVLYKVESVLNSLIGASVHTTVQVSSGSRNYLSDTAVPDEVAISIQASVKPPQRGGH